MRIHQTGTSLLRLDPGRALAGLDWAEVFPDGGPIEVEVGIGKGRFLLEAAAARPGVRMLGIEWANEYLSIAEERAARRGIQNVRFVRADARELVCRAIPSASVRSYYVFYPDPWPKTRHHKRRFFQAETVDHLGRTLIEGGLLHVATDHEDYWVWILERLTGHPAFARLGEFGGPEFPLPPNAPLTNFESKYVVQGRSRHRGSWQRSAARCAPPPPPSGSGWRRAPSAPERDGAA
jgi:tRNA (guanine-N7-)-methyltransferase